MIQLSEFFQYSFVLILKRKCLVRANRVRCRESGTPSTIIYTRWSSRRFELGCDAPVCETLATDDVILMTTSAAQPVVDAEKRKQIDDWKEIQIQWQYNKI